MASRQQDEQQEPHHLDSQKQLQLQLPPHHDVTANDDERRRVVDVNGDRIHRRQAAKNNLHDETTIEDNDMNVLRHEVQLLRAQLQSQTIFAIHVQAQHEAQQRMARLRHRHRHRQPQSQPQSPQQKRTVAAVAAAQQQPLQQHLTDNSETDATASIMSTTGMTPTAATTTTTTTRTNHHHHHHHNHHDSQLFLLLVEREREIHQLCRALDDQEESWRQKLQQQQAQHVQDLQGLIIQEETRLQEQVELQKCQHELHRLQQLQLQQENSSSNNHNHNKDEEIARLKDELQGSGDKMITLLKEIRHLNEQLQYEKSKSQEQGQQQWEHEQEQQDQQEQEYEHYDHNDDDDDDEQYENHQRQHYDDHESRNQDEPDYCSGPGEENAHRGNINGNQEEEDGDGDGKVIVTTSAAAAAAAAAATTANGQGESGIIFEGGKGDRNGAFVTANGRNQDRDAGEADHKSLSAKGIAIGAETNGIRESEIAHGDGNLKEGDMVQENGYKQDHSVQDSCRDDIGKNNKPKKADREIENSEVVKLKQELRQQEQLVQQLKKENEGNFGLFQEIRHLRDQLRDGSNTPSSTPTEEPNKLDNGQRSQEALSTEVRLLAAKLQEETARRARLEEAIQQQQKQQQKHERRLRTTPLVRDTSESSNLVDDSQGSWGQDKIDEVSPDEDTPTTDNRMRIWSQRRDPPHWAIQRNSGHRRHRDTSERAARPRKQQQKVRTIVETRLPRIPRIVDNVHLSHKFEGLPPPPDHVRLPPGTILYPCPINGCIHTLKVSSGLNPPVENGQVSDKYTWPDELRDYAFRMRKHMALAHPNFSPEDWPLGFAPKATLSIR